MCRFLTENDYITITNIKKKLVGDWSVVLISGGKKMYLSKLYKKNLGSIPYKYCECKLKLSDEQTLKLTYEFALKVANFNKPSGTKDKIGLVNSKGVQIIL